MEKLRSKARARYAFAAFLGEHGKRCTPERLLVLDTVMEQRGAFTAEELLEACRAGCGGLKVCRATVFNTLPLMVSAGVLRRNIVDSTYEPVRSTAAQKPREMLVCTACGKVQKRTSPALAAWLESQNFRDFAGRTESAVIYIYGECSACRKRQKTKLNQKIQ